MFLGVNDKKLALFINDNIVVTPSRSVKLLGINIDRELKFDLHINNVCRLANFKVRCLYRIRQFLDNQQARRLCNAFVLSNFNYCPLIWMYCSKALNAKINLVHKRALRAVTGAFTDSFEELLISEDELTIHQRNLKVLLTEIYKCLSDSYPEIMRTVFAFKSPSYSLRNSILLSLPPTKFIRFGTNSILFRGSQLWNKLPDSIKHSKNVTLFKEGVSSWAGLNCFCPLCKTQVYLVFQILNFTFDSWF